ncbi:MAG: hydantoinase/oxoprolinase family protein, partial [Acidobacteria bacterium]|nr:hydantoinase/oxoprolinase family protein [Acidobacteriota bacterium]
PPLVPRSLRLGVKERTAAGAKILSSPSPRELQQLRKKILRSGAEAVAVCFLFSFANPANEQRVTKALRSLGLPVSVSHEILPEFREYERFSTTVVNAYLAPSVGRYLSRLRRQANRRLSGSRAVSRKDSRNSAGIFLMQSSGGITTSGRAAQEPVRTILSGPAGGVMAAEWWMDLLGLRRAISFDMGGTSTDVCLLDGRARTTGETTLAGLPIAVPVLDVHSVGAGGGSLARLDAGGALRVGPRSAGADPGPICYGRGNRQPTVTDAHLLLGRLDPHFFLGGKFRLDAEAAHEGFQEFLRRERKSRVASLSSPLELARGIVSVSNANMQQALRVISIERGYDPRDFALICFGGAGGLQAADLASALGLTPVIVPPNPGAFSAVGILFSDIVLDFSQSVLFRLPGASQSSSSRVAAEIWNGLRQAFGQLEKKGRAALRRDGFASEQARAELGLQVRYLGQSYELSVPFRRSFADQFHQEHERVYGYSDPARPIEVVNLRLRLRIRTPKRPSRPSQPRKPMEPKAALLQHKPVWFERRWHRTPFYRRETLQPENRIPGPVVICEYSSTTVVPPGFVCSVDAFLNLVIRAANSRDPT